jgi:hypothetical protein
VRADHHSNANQVTNVGRAARIPRRAFGGAWRIPRLGLAAAIASGLLLATPSQPDAHEIPTSVLIQAFIKPEGAHLHLLVRVPLAAMRDVNFPLRGPGYLDVTRVDSLLNEAAVLWIAQYIQMYEGDALLSFDHITAARVSLPSDRSFGSYTDAVAHLSAPPLAAGIDLPWQQALLDVMFEYPIRSDTSHFSIRPELARLGIHTTTVLRFLPTGRAERAFEYLGDPGLVRLDPRWHQAALRFVDLGFHHILGGIDHLLFILCLVLPFRRVRPLIAIVTSFTVAHSITLIASAAGYAPSALWFPPLIEVLIALSIAYTALENIVGPQLRRRWLIAFGFGLVHGFGFSFALRESLQFAGSHLATSLFSFNIGVELGQVLVLVLAVPLLNVVFRRLVAERMGTIIVSALVAHTAWHWMTDRVATLRQYQFQWPALDAALLASAMRWMMVVLMLVGALWGLAVLWRRIGRTGGEEAGSGSVRAQ